MYVKIHKAKNKNGTIREYLQIVETKRVEGKPYPQQRLVLNVARLDGIDEKTRKMLVRLAHGILKAVGEDVPGQEKEPMIQKTGEWYHWGLFALVESIWKHLSLDKLSRSILKKTRIQYPLDRVWLAIVGARLYGKISELGVWRWTEKLYEGFGMGAIQLQHLYRGLEVLSRSWERFEEMLRWRVLDLFHQDARVIFLDTTSLTYWGEGDGEWIHHGFSKQKRGDKKQLIVGIALVNGLPIGIEIKPGNTADVDTMREMIKRFSERFDFRDVCIVSDAGMVSLGDVRIYHEQGWQYLVRARHREKEVESAVQQARADSSGWEEVSEGLLARRFRVRLPGNHGDEKWEELIVVLNRQQEAYERQVREDVVNRLRAMEGREVRELVKNRSYRRYLATQERIEVDEEKVKRSALWDGIWVLRTNRRFEHLGEAIERYKELWQVERAFRELKNLWEVVPIYHWNLDRIKGHIYACFLSFIIGMFIQRQIRNQKVVLPLEEVLEQLKELRVEWIKVNDKRFLVRDKLNSWEKELFSHFQVKIPPSVLEIV